MTTVDQKIDEVERLLQIAGLDGHLQPELGVEALNFLRGESDKWVKSGKDDRVMVCRVLARRALVLRSQSFLAAEFFRSMKMLIADDFNLAPEGDRATQQVHRMHTCEAWKIMVDEAHYFAEWLDQISYKLLNADLSKDLVDLKPDDDG